MNFETTDRTIICTVVTLFLTQIKYSYGLNVQDLSFTLTEHFQTSNESLEVKVMTSYDELMIQKILLNYKDVPSWSAVAMMFSFCARHMCRTLAQHATHCCMHHFCLQNLGYL